MATGTNLRHIAGHDRTTPPPAVVTYTNTGDPWTSNKPTGLDWDKHRAPEPQTPPTPPAPTPAPARRTKPTSRPVHYNKCACGQPKTERSQHCTTCYKQIRTKRATAKRKTRETKRPRRPRPSIVDVPTARTEYEAGATCPEIARKHGWPVVSVRRQLQKAGVTMRDDRTTHSGSTTMERGNPDMVDKVRTLYLDHGLSQAAIARQLGVSIHTIQRLMVRNQIPARQGQSGGGDTLQGYRDRLTELGVTTTQVRSWARSEGIDVPDRGAVPLTLLDRYEHHLEAGA